MTRAEQYLRDQMPKESNNHVCRDDLYTYYEENINQSTMSTPYCGHTHKDKGQEDEHNVTTGHQAPERRTYDCHNTEHNIMHLQKKAIMYDITQEKE